MASNQRKDEHTEKKTESRRKVLKQSLLGGAAIGVGVTAQKWHKPIVDAVVLPAHAQTSDPTEGGGGSTTADPGAATTTAAPVNLSFRTPAVVSSESNSLIEQVGALLISSATAGKGQSNFFADIGIEVTGNEVDGLTFIAKVLLDDFDFNQIFMTASGDVGGAPANWVDENGCIKGSAGTIAVSAANEMGAQYDIDVSNLLFSESGTLPIGSGFPADNADCQAPK